MTTSPVTSKTRSCFATECDRTKRLNANMIERRRMQNINTGFTNLKKLLPPSDKKQTKAAILQQASQHIVRLQRAILQVKSENEFLRQRLSVVDECQRSSARKPVGESCLCYCGTSSASCTPRACASSHTEVGFEMNYSPSPDVRPMTHFSQIHEARRGSYAHSIVPKPHPSDSKASLVTHNPFGHAVRQSSPLKLKPSSSYSGVDLQAYEHAFDAGPLTPPFTPPDHRSRSAVTGMTRSQSYSGAIGTHTYAESRGVGLTSYTESLAMLLQQPGIDPSKPAENVFSNSPLEKQDSHETTILGAVEFRRGACATLEKNKGVARRLSEVMGSHTSTGEKSGAGNLDCLLEAISMVEEK